MSAPVLDLDSHEGGAKASIKFDAMSSGERLHFLSAAVTALFTGKAQFKTPHARTLHRGFQTRLSFNDQPTAGRL